MSDTGESLSDFRGTVRLFPLPNLVLFPHVVQPLHIFEPRYRQMMADALEDDRRLAIALLRPGWEEDYHKRPPIHPVVCVGRILQEALLSDGRYNLLLHGLARARVVDEVPTDRLYRTGRVELMDDVPLSSSGDEKALRGELARLTGLWFASQPMALEQSRKLLGGELGLGSLCDVFSFALPLDAEFKQELLADADVESRARKLLGHLKTHAPADSPGRSFPPGFSTN